MDPLTQGVLGAALPQSTRANGGGVNKLRIALAGALGMVGGMAADLDVLIYSNIDPLLFLTYHRQFTHSLVFIPFGGFLVALIFHGLLGRRWHIPFWHSVFSCSLGYATHALLDASTSYGTMLLWPFVETRYSWSIISIVDPLFTLPLVLSVVVAAVRDDPRFARIGLAWALFYLGAGWFQHQSARVMAEHLASTRGHAPLRFEIKPSFGNILVWKSIYETEHKFFIDAYRVGVAHKTYEGTSVPKLNLKHDFPWLLSNSQQARDIDRFNHFSDHFSAVDPTNSNRIIDVRYSFVPNEINALFAIELVPSASLTDHIQFQTDRQQARQKLSQLWKMIIE